MNIEILRNYDNAKPCIWMHCASLGEYEMGIPLIEKIKAEQPDTPIVITFFSPSGYEVVAPKSSYTILYLPFDLPSLQKDFVESINPKLVIYVKYEYWYNLIQILSEKKIPQIVISALMNERKLYFKWFGKWFLKQLKKLNYFFVQDKKTYELLKNKGFENVLVSGDTRFDRVKENKDGAPEFPIIKNFKGNKPLIIGGSTWERGNQLFLEFIKINMNAEAKFIIAPHEINLQKIEELKNQFTEILEKESVKRYSELSENSALEFLKLIIIDSVGILKYLYQYADISYVGGGFRKGGLHNILEPSVFGNALIIGPEFEEFPEAVEMYKNHDLLTVSNSEEFNETLSKFLTDNSYLNQQKEKAKQFVYSKPNSVQLIYNELIKRIL